MPKAKPISLYPLSFEEAIAALMQAKPKTQKKKLGVTKKQPS